MKIETVKKPCLVPNCTGSRGGIGGLCARHWVMVPSDTKIDVLRAQDDDERLALFRRKSALRDLFGHEWQDF